MNGLPIRQPTRLTAPSAVSTRVVGIAVARGGRALDVVHRFDQIVDAERDRGDEDEPEELEAGEHVADRRQRDGESEVREQPGRRCPRSCRPSATAERVDAHAMAVPTAMATRPAGTPFQ